MKEKVIQWFKTNTISIAILIAILLYIIARYSFSQGTVQYRSDATIERQEIVNRIDELKEEIEELEIKIDELKEESN